MPKFKRSTLIAFVIVFILSTTLSTSPAHAAGIVVNNDGDIVADDGVCTLREAITAANTNTTSGSTIGECSAGDPAPTVDEITFAGNYTITLSLNSQLPTITTPLIITGNGKDNTIIRAHTCDPTPISSSTCTHNYRVMQITGATVVLNDLTIRNGRRTTADGGGIFINGTSDVTLNAVSVFSNATENAGNDGGGIYVEGSEVTIDNDTWIDFNETVNDGGGIYVIDAEVTIDNDSWMDDNVAGNDGGGIYAGDSEIIIQNGGWLEDNIAGNYGGGIYATGATVIVDDGILTYNRAEEGGGIFHANNSSLTVRNNSIIEANEATDGKGGGIFHENENGGSTTISYSEIFDNESDSYGAGVYGGGIEDEYIDSGTLDVDHSAIFGNTAYNDEGGGIVTYGPVMTISDSVIYNNISYENGDAGVGAWAPTTITNTTISGNNAPNATASAGGLGVYQTTVTLYNVTITNNSGDGAGGGISDWAEPTSIINVYNSIIANNNDSYAPDCYFESGTVNFNSAPSILRDTTGCSNITNTGAVLPAGTDPLLQSLVDNGGPTLTHAISSVTSPAVDASGASATTADQRGVVVYGSARDLGAFEFEEEEDPDTLPATGFAPWRVTHLPQQPASKAYTSSDLWMEIPKLGVKMDIVGVPVVNGKWDVAWLGDNAGWLEGTAFPTYAGNTGITAHVWNANNNPGPFANLKKLQHGDVVEIHAWGYVYTYSVRYNYLTTPTNTTPLRHEEYDWITLLTCERYSPTHENYRFRRVVRAVLVDVRAGHANVEGLAFDISD